MNKVYFCNRGIFDLRAMLTFGVSAKENDQAIGYFGTGFKYAIAIILRLNGKITVHSDGHKYEFTKASEIIRGKQFDMVYVNGEAAGFTTHLGTNWLPWQAYRELYCNCKDECGEITDTLPAFHSGVVVEVDCREIYEAYLQTSEYIITSSPICKVSYGEVHNRPSNYLFYRGIAVQRLQKPALFTYNITQQMSLTEDRTAQSEWLAHLYATRIAQDIEDPAVVRKILCAKADTFERGMRVDYNNHTSDVFINVAIELIKSGIGVSEYVRSLIVKTKGAQGEWPEFPLTPVQAKMLSRASEFVTKLGMDMSLFPIYTVEGLGDGVMGRALDGKIFLSELPFNMGTKQLASTLLEEWVHNKHGVEDFDRAMQNWLFNKILSLGEQLLNEPI